MLSPLSGFISSVFLPLAILIPFDIILVIYFLVEKTQPQENKYGAPAVPKTGPESVTPVAATSVLTTQSDLSVPAALTPDSKMDSKPDIVSDSNFADSSTSADGGSSSSD